MINVYYLESYLEFRSHDSTIQEIVLYLKNNLGANIIHQNYDSTEIKEFGHKLYECELLIHDTDTDTLKGLTFADNKNGISDIFIKRNKIGDILLISQYHNFMLLNYDKTSFNCKILESIYQPDKSYVNFDVFYAKRVLMKDFIDKIFFKGNVGGCGRFSIYELEKTPYFYGGEGHTLTIDYFNEAIEYKVGLSIPGVGELCYRDIEYLAIGLPMLRIEYMTQLNPPLIPNYHYISIDRGDEFVPDCYLDRKGGVKYSEAYIKRFLEVKDDIEFLNFISKNAREYYFNFLHPLNRNKHLVKLLEL